MPINYSASHDQSNMQEGMASGYENLKKVKDDLEKLENLSPSELEKKTREELDAYKDEVIKLVKYAKQIVTDLNESAKKLNSIQQTPPEEKLRKAKALLAPDKLLSKVEKNRFKKIEEALSNTCIIKSSGDETVKYQLGVLGSAREKNSISQTEFDYLTVIRFTENNLLDAYKFHPTNDMLIEQTPLAICQAIDRELSVDPDYEESKVLFEQRLKGIDHELRLKKLDKSLEQGLERDLTLCREQLKISPNEGMQNSKESPETVDLPSLPEIPAIELEAIDPQKTPHEKVREIENPEEEIKKLELVKLMEELIPEGKKNAIHLDSITPIAVEKIMKITLERPSPLPENKKKELYYSGIMKAGEITMTAQRKMQEAIKNPTYASCGSATYEEMIRDLCKLEKENSEKSQETKPCQLEGQDLVRAYFRVGGRRLEDKETNINQKIKNLKENKKESWGEFNSEALKKEYPDYSHWSSGDKKEIRKEIYNKNAKELYTQLEKTNRQQALLKGEKTFMRYVFDEKSGKAKQKKEVAFSEQEIEARNLIRNYPKYKSENKKVNVYLNGVYLVSSKKDESAASTSAELTESNTKGFSRSPHKKSLDRRIGGFSSAAFFSAGYANTEAAEKEPHKNARLMS